MKNKRLTLRLYRDAKGEFRWTLIASNGRKLADSGEGYKRRKAMERSLTKVLTNQCPFCYSVRALVGDFRPDITLDDISEHGKAK